ncbi:unnamed protein product [Auanema sp. JU1783]|nr:unnamed protein product [Auanema sp. JU1783]
MADPRPVTVTATENGATTSAATLRDAREQEVEEDEHEMQYGANHVIHLFVPVSLCMAMVVITMNTITFYSKNGGRHLIYTPFVKDTESIGEQALMSFGNAIVMLGVVIFMTSLLIVFYKYRCYKVIHGWLILSSFLLLFCFTTMYTHEVMKFYDISLSTVSVGFFLMNFGVLGMMCVHWKGPLRLQQFYLITISALMALVFIKYLPEWTVWPVLAVISIWDLVAVLSPRGPLRILVETAQERNESIFPALIYSSGVMYPYILLGMAEEIAIEPSNVQQGNGPEPSTSDSTLLSENSSPEKKRNKVKRIAVPPPPTAASTSENRVTSEVAYTEFQTQRPQSSSNSRIVEEKGVKLGLGDFIFYSVLVGKASSYFDWNTTVACYIAILVGLCFTLLLLAVFKRALPALPISIFAGLIFYFSTRWIVTPFVSELTRRQIIY